MENYFIKLNSLNVSEHIEKKNNLNYLSWAWAWGEVKKVHHDANYKVYENKDGWNYHNDGKTGWVKVGVIVQEIEHIEYLPIMDYKNKSIPLEQITSFNVNTSIQRCLTKAIARHGLGLYIYAGEDLPEEEKKEVKSYIEQLKEKLILNNIPDNARTLFLMENANTETEAENFIKNDKDFKDILTAHCSNLMNLYRDGISNSGKADLIEESKKVKKISDLEKIWNLI